MKRRYQTTCTTFSRPRPRMPAYVAFALLVCPLTPALAQDPPGETEIRAAFGAELPAY